MLSLMTYTECPSSSQNNCSHEASNENDVVCAIFIGAPPRPSVAGRKMRSTWL